MSVLKRRQQKRSRAANVRELTKCDGTCHESDEGDDCPKCCNVYDSTGKHLIACDGCLFYGAMDGFR